MPSSELHAGKQAPEPTWDQRVLPRRFVVDRQAGRRIVFPMEIWRRMSSTVYGCCHQSHFFGLVQSPQFGATFVALKARIVAFSTPWAAASRKTAANALKPASV
jgi:hypothetical protein